MMLNGMPSLLRCKGPSLRFPRAFLRSVSTAMKSPVLIMHILLTSTKALRIMARSDSEKLSLDDSGTGRYVV